jgi:hypothetical protein
MENKELLEKVYNETLEAALEAEPGSEEHSAIVNDIVKLGGVVREDVKLDGEFAKQFENRCEAEIQRKHDWKKFIITTGVTVVVAAAGGVLKHVWRGRTLEFEKEGTFTTFVGKYIFKDK